MISRRSVLCLLAGLPLQGRFFEPILAAQSSKTLYLVPLGAEAGEAVAYVAQYMSETFKVKAQVAAPLALDRRAFNATRSQYNAAELAGQITRELPKVAEYPQGVMVAITAADMYIPGFDWSFAFAYRPSNRLAVVSMARMMLPSVQIPAPTKATQFARMLKMTLKHVGGMFYGHGLSSDPKSLMYNQILGLDELDRIEFHW